MPDRSSPKRGQPANISITNRRESNSPRLIGRLKPAPTNTYLLMRAIQTLVPDSFCPLTNPQPYQRDRAEPPLAGASVANIENCFIKLKRLNTAASDWLNIWCHCLLARSLGRVVVGNQPPAPLLLYPHPGKASVTGNSFAFVLPIHC